MKKILCFLIVLTGILLIGCNNQFSINDYFSEITKIYFEGQSDNIFASICVGERENPYIIDGKHNPTCDFSLITLKFNSQIVENSIFVVLTINDNVNNIKLDLNPANNSYMTDLGYLLKKDDKITIEYQNNIVLLSNISENFQKKLGILTMLCTLPCPT